MLDLAGIAFSCLMMLLVIVRAIKLDRTQPWFQTLQKTGDVAVKPSAPWRRRT